METTLTITALHCHKCDPEYIRQLKNYLFTHIGSSPSEDLQTLLDPYTSLVAAICCAVDMVINGMWNVPNFVVFLSPIRCQSFCMIIHQRQQV
ncbi:hypothetical protein C1H46_040812 [Malus baccata]|uniref:Uncharacterized protein n=1 Tax=Malus baccata TaxID=106549 RepID=A0A540KHF0_MALBA|nr:hypothetical protein C1H46_040812 [Malus baccata]